MAAMLSYALLDETALCHTLQAQSSFEMLGKNLIPESTVRKLNILSGLLVLRPDAYDTALNGLRIRDFSQSGFLENMENVEKNRKKHWFKHKCSSLYRRAVKKITGRKLPDDVDIAISGFCSQVLDVSEMVCKGDSLVYPLAMDIWREHFVLTDLIESMGSNAFVSKPSHVKILLELIPQNQKKQAAKLLHKPLYDACIAGCLESVNLLIAAGADVNHKFTAEEVGYYVDNSLLGRLKKIFLKEARENWKFINEHHAESCLDIALSFEVSQCSSSERVQCICALILAGANPVINCKHVLTLCEIPSLAHCLDAISEALAKRSAKIS